MITQKMFFQINDGKPKEFAQVENDERFIINIGPYATKKEIEELEKLEATWSLIEFKDAEGNVFRIFNQPID